MNVVGGEKFWYGADGPRRKKRFDCTASPSILTVEGRSLYEHIVRGSRRRPISGSIYCETTTRSD
jgi:hypothetical protein